MSTTMVDSWSVDLATIGPIYPLVGGEVLMLILLLAFWIIWQIWQIRFENQTYREELRRLNSPDKIERAMRERRYE